MQKNKYSIAVIAGDGIGKEVMPEGIRCLEAISLKHGINLDFKEYDFSSVDYYEKHGSMLPDDWAEVYTLRRFQDLRLIVHNYHMFFV